MSVTYICVGRDPRDVALSMDDHLANLDWDEFHALAVAAAREDGLPEPEMIDGVLNHGKVRRFRSKTNASRVKNANHFSLDSPSVAAVYVNVGGIHVRLK